VVRLAQQHLQRQPPRLVEVPRLVDDQRVEPRTESFDRLGQERRQRSSEPPRVAVAGLVEARLPARVDTELVEPRDVHDGIGDKTGAIMLPPMSEGP
jgi:hypothetical protein